MSGDKFEEAKTNFEQARTKLTGLLNSIDNTNKAKKIDEAAGQFIEQNRNSIMITQITNQLNSTYESVKKISEKEPPTMDDAETIARVTASCLRSIQDRTSKTSVEKVSSISDSSATIAMC